MYISVFMNNLLQTNHSNWTPKLMNFSVMYVKQIMLGEIYSNQWLNVCCFHACTGQAILPLFSLSIKLLTKINLDHINKRLILQWKSTINARYRWNSHVMQATVRTIRCSKCLTIKCADGCLIINASNLWYANPVHRHSWSIPRRPSPALPTVICRPPVLSLKYFRLTAMWGLIKLSGKPIETLKNSHIWRLSARLACISIAVIVGNDTEIDETQAGSVERRRTSSQSPI